MQESGQTCLCFSWGHPVNHSANSKHNTAHSINDSAISAKIQLNQSMIQRLQQKFSEARKLWISPFSSHKKSNRS